MDDLKQKNIIQTRSCSFKAKDNIRKRDKLLNFIRRRPTKEDLICKGIIKNEAVFGNILEDIQDKDESGVPKFVIKCIENIKKDDFLKISGIYRLCGLLSTVQKVRCHVNQDNLKILEKVEDKHVLTGSDALG